MASKTIRLQHQNKNLSSLHRNREFNPERIHYTELKIQGRHMILSKTDVHHGW
jgi:hypothetical protein